MTKQQTIEERVNSALNGSGTSSATLSELVKETESAIEAAATVAEQEHARALDLTTPDPNAAAELARAAALKGDRLRPVIPRLREKLAEAITSELHGKWLSNYRRVEAERDQLAAEFSDKYPRLADELIDLFVRMQQCDYRARQVDHAAADFNAEHRRLGSVEQTARAAHAHSGYSGPDLLPNIQLPDFHASRNMLWPPRQPSVAAAFAASMMPTPSAVAPHAGTADWWRDHDARAAQLKREAQETEAFYSAQHHEAEERENRENKERVAQAMQQRR